MVCGWVWWWDDDDDVAMVLRDGVGWSACFVDAACDCCGGCGLVSV